LTLPAQNSAHKPFTIKRQTAVTGKQNRSQLLVTITEWFLAESNPNLESIDRQPLYGSKNSFAD
jgi:hypothetical protein